MRIKHLTLMAGPAGNFPVGHEREIDDAEGAGLVVGGYALEVARRAPETTRARRGETASAAEQEAAKALQNIASAGKGGGKGKPRAAPPSPLSGAPSADVSTGAVE